ncbi:GNAT family N-acetyltransferase [Candidatus Bathyarchaeota archaeon]|nr:GNAT family N-acetyltransferase [Candidatus Bathyarchaeota archaeon]
METKDRLQIKTVLDLSPRSTMRMYELLDSLDEDWVHCYVNRSAVLFNAWAIMLWAEKEDDLIPLLKFIPTDQPETELFCIENRFKPLLEKHLAPVTVTADCYTWTLDQLREEAPVLESLTVEDAEFVNDQWDYKSDQSLEFIRHCIETMPSSCVRNEEGQPVAMAFCYGQSPYYINMGGFKVLPEYRQRGIGRKIHLDMCRKVLAQNRKPLVHVKTDNLISQHICQSTNFKRHEQVFWGTLKFSK